MDYPTLLLQLENQLQSLHKKGIGYLNIEAMPKVELRRLLEGFGELVVSQTEVIDERQAHLFSFSAQTKPAANIQHENTDNRIFPPSTSIENFQERKPFVKGQNVAEVFSNIKTEQEKENKITSLSELAQKYKSCQRCALGKTRTNLVFGSGLSHSTLMFIGEGPGADEDTQGEPFVGRAGKLLTKMINTVGIERDDVYITNIVKCRPPENRNPTPAEISCCLPIIKQQIKLLNPKLIVTLGNVPTQTLIPDLPGITKVRGRIMQYEKFTMLPTYHPSYLLRNRSALTLAWEDFKKIPELAFNS